MQDPLTHLVRAALEEDHAWKDITTLATVEAERRSNVKLLAKQAGVLSGIHPFRRAFELMDAEVEGWEALHDGDAFEAGTIVARFTARSRAALMAERTGMNFIQHLSGIATETAAYVKSLEGLPCHICATRKTTPLLRDLEKAAVVHGGGANHRHSLIDGILIKENHIAAAGGIREAVERARHHAHHLMGIEVEVRNFEELQMALDIGVQIIMLDNMDVPALQEAVRMTHDHAAARNQHPPKLEASGNVNLERVRGIAETGVNIISVGSITHSSTSLDLSLLIDHD